MFVDGAREDSWKTEPAGPVRRVDYRDEFTDHEFEQLSVGLIPQQMEDKWFMHFDGLTAHLHRSWTGQHVYRIDFAPEPGGFTVGQAWVATHAAQGQLDAALLRFLLRGLVLGQDVPFPVPHDIDTDQEPVFKHAPVGQQPAATVAVAPSSWPIRIRRRLALLRRSPRRR